MIQLTKTMEDKKGIVKKLIFEDESAIAEVVVYKYADRGVICFSVQSGCEVGCVFCGTGKRFIRNLTKAEMQLQIEEGLKLLDGCNKIQIMSMSMGEPLNNWDNIPINEYLNRGYYFFVSSVGLRGFDYDNIYMLGRKSDKFGFQISLHHWDNKTRKILLGSYPTLLDIYEIIIIADDFKKHTGRNLYFNYIAKGGENVRAIYDIVKHGHITVSVLCHKKLQSANLAKSQELFEKIQAIDSMQSIKIFNPEGQDTIGGGCGQLIYVQEKFNKTNSPVGE